MAITASNHIDGLLLQRQPCIIRELACLLEDEALFIDVLRHAAGSRAAQTVDITTMPQGLAAIVNKQAHSIERVVKRACKRLASPQQG